MINESKSIRTRTCTTHRRFLKTFVGIAMVLGLSAGFAAVSRKTQASSPLISSDDRQAYSEPYASNTGTLEPQGPYIYWTFGQISRGDCTIAPGSTFYLYANGATRWVCDLRSSDSGDEWDGRFDITNINGQVLASTPNYHFDISQDNVTKHWDESRGPNASLAAAYSQARGISFVCSC